MTEPRLGRPSLVPPPADVIQLRRTRSRTRASELFFIAAPFVSGPQACVVTREAAKGGVEFRLGVVVLPTNTPQAPPEKQTLISAALSVAAFEYQELIEAYRADATFMDLLPKSVTMSPFVSKTDGRIAESIRLAIDRLHRLRPFIDVARQKQPEMSEHHKQSLLNRLPPKSAAARLVQRGISTNPVNHDLDVIGDELTDALTQLEFWNPWLIAESTVPRRKGLAERWAIVRHWHMWDKSGMNRRKFWDAIHPRRSHTPSNDDLATMMSTANGMGLSR